MTTRDFTANVISASKVVPDGNFKNSAASGVWDINEALDLIKSGNWPNAANVNPAAFVDALFSTHLYIGAGGTTATIDNGIDLLNKGGLVWIKARNATENHGLFDTERGVTKYISSNTTAAEATNSGTLTNFYDDGFKVDGNGIVGSSTDPYVSWTFRKQPKFFDVLTYTGSGGAQNISHNLGSTPGMIFVKNLSNTQSWYVFHRSVGETKGLILEGTYAAILGTSYWNDTAPTSTQFTVGANASDNGDSYVAYLFAHNDDDGGFGEPGDQDIIKCGSYTGNGADDGPTVDLGFEPQFIFLKRTDSTSQWNIVDTMRGLVTGGNDVRLYPNLTNTDDGFNFIEVTPTGFKLESSATAYNENNGTYIYMAIRRGGMQTPTAASDVFAIDTVQSSSGTGPAFISGFVTDFIFSRQATATQDWLTNARLIGTNQVKLNSNNGQSTNSAFNWDYMNGAWDPFSASPVFSAWMWKRARGFFDVVAYTGTGVSGRTVSHNLGVSPEMMWVKRRSGVNNWTVYVGDATDYLRLNTDDPTSDGDIAWNDTAPTASVFSVGNHNLVNGSGETYIASLFATLAGVSKVGSFTQSGATNVACGFSGDTPSLIILKRSDSAGDWYLFDYANGIVSGNDPYNLLNSDAAQVTNADIVDPYSGGFATTSSLTDGDYVFYAIAAIS